MKKFDLKKMHTLERWLHSLVTSLKRSFKIIGDESGPASDQGVSMSGLSNTFLAYAEHQKMNAIMLEMERHKAEAIQHFMRERTRYT